MGENDYTNLTRIGDGGDGSTFLILIELWKRGGWKVKEEHQD